MTTEQTPDVATLFALLGNRRRLLVLGYLALFEPGASVEVRQLARIVRSLELEKPPRQVSTADYESAYNGLIQTHLPKLDAEGVVEYDDQRKIATVTDQVRVYALLIHLGRWLCR